MVGISIVWIQVPVNYSSTSIKNSKDNLTKGQSTKPYESLVRNPNPNKQTTQI